MEGYWTVGGNFPLFSSVLTIIELNLEGPFLRYLVKTVFAVISWPWGFMIRDTSAAINGLIQDRTERVGAYCASKEGRSQPHLLLG